MLLQAAVIQAMVVSAGERMLEQEGASLKTSRETGLGEVPGVTTAHLDLGSTTHAWKR